MLFRSGVGRSSLDALLANVIDPNLVVGKGYENVEVETKDGRSLSGRLVEDTATRVKLLSAGPKEEVLANGALAFIPNPFDVRELDRLVALALSARRGPPVEG